ncbi:hypothetical protein M3C21_07315 [Micrococcus luteus]|nr:hypothetical protein [Micrococcus luteus]
MIADQATGRPLAGVRVTVEDAETGVPVQPYRDGAPVQLVTGAHGLITEWQTDDTTRRVALTAGSVRLTQWCEELQGTAADAVSLMDDRLSGAAKIAEQAAAIRDGLEPRVQSVEERQAALESLAEIGPSTPVDGQTASLVLQPDTQTRAAVDGLIAPRVAGLAPSPLSGVSVAQIGAADVRPVDRIGDTLWGVSGGRLATSEDWGLTWADAGPAPGGFVIRLVHTSTGGLLAMTDKFIYTSASREQLVWEQKATTNGATQFQPWSLAHDPEGRRFLTTEYAAGSSFPDSRYARMSHDGGQTWTVAYDSVALHGQAAADGSHLHGCAYDEWADRWIISEGHSNTGDIGGLYVSEDDGDTWTRAPGMVKSPAPTVIVATDGGLVCGSDSTDGGVFGVVRQAVARQELRHVWRWHTGVDGTCGFGVQGDRDPETGVVLIGFRTEKATVPPIIAGGTPTAGAKLWTWPSTYTAYDDVNTVLPLPGGEVLASARTGTTRWLVRGRMGAPTVTHPTVEDTGHTLGGTAGRGDSIAVGPLSSSGATIRGTAVGVSAVTSAVQDATVVGHGSTASGNFATALGAGTTAGVSGTAIGQGARTSGSQATVMGALAKGGGQSVVIGQGVTGPDASALIGYGVTHSTGTGGSALGWKAQTGNFGTAVGTQAVSTAPNTAAVGAGATASGGNSTAVGRSATASHDEAVALGKGTASTAAHQTTIGKRHLRLEPAPVTPPITTDGAHIFLRTGADGKAELCVRFASNNPIVIARDG